MIVYITNMLPHVKVLSTWRLDWSRLKFNLCENNGGSKDQTMDHNVKS
jgi:hypothetical protein